MLTRAIALLVCALALCACGGKPAGTTPGQALASVNGVEVTVLQLNDELARAGAGAGGAAAAQDASKQLLQTLIDCQLLQAEAAREKLDRDPKVMQAIERARALIVAQAWLQKRIGNLAEPTPADIEAYYNAHPQFFVGRKQFAMDQLQLPAAALTPALKQVVDSARTLDDVRAWLLENKVSASRSHVARSTADLAPPLATRLLAMRKGQVFAVQEGERVLVIGLADVQDAPVTLAMARPQIAQFLVRQRQKESAGAELARLRAGAKIEYFNKALAANGGPPPGPDAGSPTAGDDVTAGAARDRGVAGLK